MRTRCGACGGGSICAHGRRRSRCNECGGSAASLCAEHGLRRDQCRVCELLNGVMDMDDVTCLDIGELVG